MITETNEHYDYRMNVLIEKYGPDFLKKCELYKTAEHQHLGYVQLLEWNGVAKRYRIKDGKGWIGWMDVLELDNFVL